MLARVSERAWIQVYREESRHAQNGRCAYCHSLLTRAGTTADHVRARIKGGSTAAGNIKAACQPCNKTKGSMGEKAFLRAIKNPEPGDSIFLWLAWSRRRIALAAERACKHILEAA